MTPRQAVEQYATDLLLGNRNIDRSNGWQRDKSPKHKQLVFAHVGSGHVILLRSIGQGAQFEYLRDDQEWFDDGSQMNLFEGTVLMWQPIPNEVIEGHYEIPITSIKV